MTNNNCVLGKIRLSKLNIIFFLKSEHATIQGRTTNGPLNSGVV